MSQLTDVYSELALERRHICTGCDGKKFLSHSHLVPRSYRKDLECVKANITYHCLDFANGCHRKWEGMGAPLLMDFLANMTYIWVTDPTYFWKKYYALEEHWTIQRGPERVKAMEKLVIVYKLTTTPK